MWRPVLDVLRGGFHPEFSQRKVYEFRRDGKDETFIASPAEFSPFFNVGGLYWRDPPSVRILANNPSPPR